MNQEKSAEIPKKTSSEEKFTTTKESNNTTENKKEASQQMAPGEAIKLVMEQAKCTRGQAIQALRQNNRDIVNAILSVVSEPSDEAPAEQAENNEIFIPEWIKNEDIEIVMLQTQRKREEAIEALRQCEGDIVNAIMALTM